MLNEMFHVRMLEIFQPCSCKPHGFLHNNNSSSSPLTKPAILFSVFCTSTHLHSWICVVYLVSAGVSVIGISMWDALQLVLPVAFTADVESIGRFLLHWYYFCFCAERNHQTNRWRNLTVWPQSAHTHKHTHKGLQRPTNTQTFTHHPVI